MGKLGYILGMMTIEPMMLVQGMASFLGMYPQDQMLLYKMCRGMFRLVRIIDGK